MVPTRAVKSARSPTPEASKAETRVASDSAPTNTLSSRAEIAPRIVPPVSSCAEIAEAASALASVAVTEVFASVFTCATRPPDSFPTVDSSALIREDCDPSVPLIVPTCVVTASNAVACAASPVSASSMVAVMASIRWPSAESLEIRAVCSVVSATTVSATALSRTSCQPAPS